MNSGRVMNLRVTIPAESRRMNVGKDVIRILGSPAYICVLQRKDRKSIALLYSMIIPQKYLVVNDILCAKITYIGQIDTHVTY